MTTQQYVFRVVEVAQVVDGDTYSLRVDVGFHLSAVIRCRLLGWDCPELHGPTAHEREEARAAATTAASWLDQAAGTLWVRTEKNADDFGRWLGEVWADGPVGPIHLGEALAKLQLATPWPTRWREVSGYPSSGTAQA